MKKLKALISTMLCLGLMCAMALPAHAMEYSFDGPGDPNYGDPTSFEPVVTPQEPSEDQSKDGALVPPGFGTPTRYLPGVGDPYLPENPGPGTVDGSDPAAPPICTLKELFRKDAAPQTVCTRFSNPAIEMPRISVKNGAVCIELCQTEYYDYIVKRENKGKTTVIYKGKYQNKIYDNSLIQGEQYVYTVIPLYKETEGTAVTLPSVRVEITQSEPDDWWN